MSSRPPKFWCGAVIKSLDELHQIYREFCADKVPRFVMFGRPYQGECRVVPKWHQKPRPVHIAWVANQSFVRLKGLIAFGSISRAEVTPAYREWLSDQRRQAELHPPRNIQTVTEENAA